MYIMFFKFADFAAHVSIMNIEFWIELDSIFTCKVIIIQRLVFTFNFMEGINKLCFIINLCKSLL